MKLGSVAAVPLSVARKNAGDLEAKVRLGGDPAMDKLAARQEADNTLGLLAAQYLEARKSKWRPNSYTEFDRHLNKYAQPLHRFPISSISQRQIVDLLDDITKKNQQSGPREPLRSV